MHAIVMRSTGPEDVLALEEVDEPQAPDGWVTVRLEASGLNWHDVLVRQGVYDTPLPHVPGADGAGTRVDTGERVIILPSLFWGPRDAAPAPGWEILGDHRQGTYAELVAVPEECVIPWPRGFDLGQAASFALSGVTVHRALMTRGRLVPGESLLILGASGGVATGATSMASALGARVVVTSSSRDKIATAQDLGARDGVLHTDPDWVTNARSASPGGAGFDIVLDSVGRWPESIACLRPGGRCVVMGASDRPSATLDIRPYYFGQYELIGSTMGSPRDMHDLMRLTEEGLVPPPVIDRTYPLAEAAQAHRRLESGAGVGKVVLTHT